MIAEKASDMIKADWGFFQDALHQVEKIQLKNIFNPLKNYFIFCIYFRVTMRMCDEDLLAIRSRIGRLNTIPVRRSHSTPVIQTALVI